MASELTSSVGRYGLMAVGGYALGPIGAAAGALVGSFLFGSSGPTVEGPRLGDLSVAASTYGGVIPIGFGVQKVAGTMIWATDIEEEKRSRTVGGGLFGSGQTVIEYRYFANFAVSFGEGPAVDILRLWAGEKLLFDRGNPLATKTPGDPGFHEAIPTLVSQDLYRFRIYPGSEDQEVDSFMAAKVLAETGEANATPAHRGMVYVVFERMPLEAFNNRIPPITAEIAWSAETPATVRNAVFAPHGSTSFQRNGFAADFRRGLLYLEGDGLHRIPTATMTEDLHLSVADLGGEAIAPRAVDSAGDVYSPALDDILKHSGDGLQFVAKVSGVDAPEIATMSAVEITGRRDFVLSIGLFARCRVYTSDLELLWPGIDIGSRKRGCVAGREAFDLCEGWFVGSNSGSGAPTATAPLLRVSVQVGLAMAAHVANLAEGSGIEHRRIDLAASTFGKSGINLGAPCYDQENDRLIVHANFDDGSKLLVALDRNGTPVWTRTPETNEALPFQARFKGGRIYTYGAGTAHVRDAATGELLRSHAGFAASVGISGLLLFDENATTFYMTGIGDVHQVIADRAVGTAASLADIVTSLVARGGLAASDIDVSELSDQVRGFAVARQVTLRGALELLAAAYRFDAVESDHLLEFKKRGRAPSRTLTQAELVPVNAERETYLETRVQEVELPLRFNVLYQDTERDSDIGTQYAKRIAGPDRSMHSRNEATLDLPLTLRASEAKAVALSQLHGAWLERTAHEWHLTWTHVDLEPADVVDILLDDSQRLTVRVIEASLGANFEIAWKTVLEDSSTYQVAPVTAGGLGYRRLSTLFGTEARPLVMDLPLLRDSDDLGRTRTGLYWAAGAHGAPWEAVVLYRSSDGVLYAAADTLLDAVTWGVAVEPLGDTPLPFQTDRTSTLRVALTSGSLSSVDDAAWLAGANRAVLLRPDGSGEIIRFKDAVQESDGTWTLSTLLRGRRGTEVFTAGHAAGELFVMLDDDDAIGRLALELTRIGEGEHLKTVARGGAVDDARAVTVVPAGNDLKPYAPAHAAATPAINQGADIAIGWVRRTRAGGALRAGSGEVNLAEDSETYELDFVDPDGAIVRTVTGLTSPAYTYTAAEQAADFPVVAVRIHQVSAQVGRGFAAELTFDGAPTFTDIGESIAEGQAAQGARELAANQVLAQRYTAVAGQVMSLSAYVASGSGTMRMGLYADSGGEAGALLGTTEAKAVSASTGGWETFAFASPVPVSDGDYWIAVHADTELGSRGPDAAAVTTGRRIVSQPYASGLPDPFGSISTYNNTRGMRMRIWTNP